MKFVLLTTIAAFCAGAAFAQDDPCRYQPNGMLIPAKETFVVNYNAATGALQAGDWDGALRNAASARPYAVGDLQVSAVQQVEIAAYHGRGDWALLVPAIEMALKTPCLPAEARSKYQQMLADRH